jgi:hypothetical protein
MPNSGKKSGRPCSLNKSDWSDDVDFRRLAAKYHFSGGVIKNVMVTTLNMADQQKSDNDGCICLTRALIEKVAGIQSEQNRQHDPFGRTYHPQGRIAELALRQPGQKTIETPGRLRKGRTSG